MHIIYDLEFDLDSFLNEMEQKKSSSRTGKDYARALSEFGGREEETEH